MGWVGCLFVGWVLVCGLGVCEVDCLWVGCLFVGWVFMSWVFVCGLGVCLWVGCW